MNISVTHSLVNGSLLSDIRWNNSFEFPDDSVQKRGYLLNLYHNKEEDTPAVTEYFTIEEQQRTFVFNSSLPWTTVFTLQTFFGEHESNETEMRGLFSDYTQLSPPEHVSVKNVVINEILAAVVAWDNSDDVDIFEGLGMSITL